MGTSFSVTTKYGRVFLPCGSEGPSHRAGSELAPTAPSLKNRLTGLLILVNAFIPGYFIIFSMVCQGKILFLTFAVWTDEESSAYFTRH